MEGDGPPSEEEILAHYQRMISDGNPVSRWKAVEGLARMDSPAAFPLLVQALSDEDWRVRQKAAWALGVVGDARAIPILQRALQGEKEDVREMIMEALSSIRRRPPAEGR
ncbi:MAG: HEAT repeat domain-containing protein [Methanolinea sp.]|nr:HEAT repeat domain-containing protein [Methanolinea sp.]